MRSVNEVARQMFAGLHHDCHGCDEGCCCDCYVAGIMPAVVKAIVKRDAEVRAVALATPEDVQAAVDRLAVVEVLDQEKGVADE